MTNGDLLEILESLVLKGDAAAYGALADWMEENGKGEAAAALRGGVDVYALRETDMDGVSSAQALIDKAKVSCCTEGEAAAFDAGAWAGSQGKFAFRTRDGALHMAAEWSRRRMGLT